GFTEIPIDAGEADVGDRVELLQRVHHQLPDLLAGDVALPARLELADDAVDDALDALLLDRPLAQRDADRAGELVAVERHPPLVGLHHGQLAQLDPLDCGEALAAGAAEAAAADRGTVLGRTAVLHLRVVMAAERAAHPPGCRSARVDREPRAQRLDPRADRLLGGLVGSV